MSKTVIDDTNTSTGVLLFGGAGTWSTNSDSGAANSTYHFNATAGAICYVTLAAGSTFTGMCFTGIATYVPAVIAVYLDNVLVRTETVWNGGGTDGNAPNEYQVTWGRVTLPQDGLAHQVTANLVSGALIVDTVELYVAETGVAKRLVAIGNSICQGVGTTINTGTGGPLGSYYGNSAAAQMAAQLGYDLGGTTQNYNFGINGGEAHCATPAYNTPAWQTIQAGASGKNWWDDQLPALALIMFGYNGARSQDPQRWGTTAALVASAQSYHRTMYVQRMQDFLTRLLLRLPATYVLVSGMPYAAANLATVGWQQTGTFTYAGDFNKGWPDNTYQPSARNDAGSWDDALHTLCTAFPNARFVATQEPLYGAGKYTSQSDAGALYDGTHPNDFGAGVLGAVLARRARALVHAAAGRGGGAY